MEKLHRRISLDHTKNIVFFNSFDGTNHLESAEGKIDLISFSTTAFNKDLLSLKDYSTSKSANILTWMQAASKEEPCMLLSVLDEHYKSRKELQESVKNSGINLHCFEVHDAKMIYNLTQHSLWNRRFHPFLLCKCKRGEAVKDPINHKCQLISDKEYVLLYEKSKKKFEKKYNNEITDQNVERHREWCDLKNYGVTHYGVDPYLLPPSSIGIDGLHNRLSNVRSIWSFIREYLERFGHALQEDFAKLLSKLIGEYYVECYQLNKNLSVMHGEQIEQFLTLIPDIITFLQTKIE